MPTPFHFTVSSVYVLIISVWDASAVFWPKATEHDFFFFYEKVNVINIYFLKLLKTLATHTKKSRNCSEVLAITEVRAVRKEIIPSVLKGTVFLKLVNK